MNLKINNLMLQPHLRGASELKALPGHDVTMWNLGVGSLP